MELLLPRKPSEVQLLDKMAADAVYEVSSDRDAEVFAMASASAIHSFVPPQKTSKLYLCGHCAFNCAYCSCRILAVGLLYIAFIMIRYGL